MGGARARVPALPSSTTSQVATGCEVAGRRVFLRGPFCDYSWAWRDDRGASIPPPKKTLVGATPNQTRLASGRRAGPRSARFRDPRAPQAPSFAITRGRARERGVALAPPPRAAQLGGSGLARVGRSPSWLHSDAIKVLWQGAFGCLTIAALIGTFLGVYH